MNKRNKTTGNGEPVSKAPRNSEGTADDEVILDSYRNQLATLKKLDVNPGHDFTEWSRTLGKELTDLKAGVAAKKKSLKRRAGDVSYITGELEAITEDIASFQTLLKTLATGASEGSGIMQGILDIIPDLTTVTSPIWERALRAIAFEDKD